jgi:Cupin domain
MKAIVVLFAIVALLSAFSFADEMKMMSKGVIDPASVQWGECPPNLPAGCKTAVMQGDPSKAGEEYTMRAWWPDGYKIMPHFHPQTENVTVISGTFHVGMGDKFDQSNAQTMAAGSFASMPATMHHYAWAEGETVVQVNGIGPFAMTYVNPADDPSMKK